MKQGGGIESQGQKGVSRRQFAALGVAAAAAGVVGTAHAAVPVSQRAVTIQTRDRTADAVFVHPQDGQHAGVVLWAETPAQIAANAEIASSLAAAGLSVLMVSAAYKSGAPAALAKNISRDSKDLTAWLDSQHEVASSQDGYALRTRQPAASLLGSRRVAAKRAAYLVATPGGRSALTVQQMAALDAAVVAVDRSAAIHA
jgi:hypothetical protein